MTVRIWGVLGAAALLALTSSCAEQVRAPTEQGVCYSVTQPDGELQFNVVARDQPQIELCAARLEEVRLRFLRMGGTNRDIVGAYQGRFIFIDRRGVAFGEVLDGPRFFALARTGDGRLAVPGAIDFSEVVPDRAPSN